MLTDKRKRFADEYLINADATAAYKAAYPRVTKDATAASAGSRLLNLPEVRAYIDERLESISTEKIAKADEVMQYLTAVMRGEYKEEVLRGEGMGEQTISDIDVSARDRIKAAELIGKRYGLWTDRVDLQGDLTLVFEDDYGD